jgi:hypothetical protein
MRRQDGHRDVDEQAVETAESPAPAPAVTPGSLAWASAVGNHAVARMASTQSVAREPVEEEEEEETEAPEPEAPDASAAAPPAGHENEEPEEEEEELAL